MKIQIKNVELELTEEEAINLIKDIKRKILCKNDIYAYIKDLDKNGIYKSTEIIKNENLMKKLIDYYFSLREKNKNIDIYTYLDGVGSIKDLKQTFEYFEESLRPYKISKHKIIDDENVILNKYGVNSEIKAHIKTDDEMKRIGFSDFNKDVWYFCKTLKPQKYKGYDSNFFDITLNITIPKNGSDIDISVIDETFLQCYDYQKMLTDNPDFKPALLILEEVEKWMDYLQQEGVLTGHIKGRYI